MCHGGGRGLGKNYKDERIKNKYFFNKVNNTWNSIKNAYHQSDTFSVVQDVIQSLLKLL